MDQNLQIIMKTRSLFATWPCREGERSWGLKELTLLAVFGFSGEEGKSFAQEESERGTKTFS